MTNEPAALLDAPVESSAEVSPPTPAPVVRESRKRPVLGIIASLLICTSMLALAWQNFDKLTHAIEARARTETAANAVSYADFDGFRRSTTASFQTIIDSLTAQQADTKRLSEQFSDMSSRLATISSKLDAHADPVAGWPKATVQPSPAFAQASAPPAARKKPPVAKPVRAISVGGAPLSIAPTP